RTSTTLPRRSESEDSGPRTHRVNVHAGAGVPISSAPESGSRAGAAPAGASLRAGEPVAEASATIARDTAIRAFFQRFAMASTLSDVPTSDQSGIGNALSASGVGRFPAHNPPPAMEV